MELALLKANRGRWPKVLTAPPYCFVYGPTLDPARRIAATIARVFRSSMCPRHWSSIRCWSARNWDWAGATCVRYAGAYSLRISPTVGIVPTTARPIVPNIPLNTLATSSAERHTSGKSYGPPPLPFRWKPLSPALPMDAPA